jgi:phosphohistidine phosphatase
MDMILWRHADAEENSPDEIRALTSKGRRQARAMAKWLREHVKGKVRVIASPALRAQETAQALVSEFETSERIAVGAQANDVLELAGWPNGEGTIIIVGHQPTLGQVASLLLTGKEGDGQFKKGAIWWFRTRGDEMEQETLLHAAIAPELLPGMG